MHSLAILDELPVGYFVEESPRGILALHVDVARRLHATGFGPEHEGPLQPSDLAGRRPLYAVELGEERFLLRRFSHGGLLRWFTGSRYVSPERPFRELILSNALLQSGVPTPQVVAARARLARGFGWCLELLTRRVDHAVDLDEALWALAEGEVPAPARSRLFHAAGELVRKLHQLGFQHADLNARNLLVRREALTTGTPEPWVLDLEGSSFVESMTRAERRRNLRRLYRSVTRIERRSEGSIVSRADLGHFLRGYDPDGREWRRDWRAIQAQHTRLAPWHALGWGLERLFGGRSRRRPSAAGAA